MMSTEEQDASHRETLAAGICPDCFGSGMRTYACMTCGGTGDAPDMAATMPADRAPLVVMTFEAMTGQRKDGEHE